MTVDIDAWLAGTRTAPTYLVEFDLYDIVGDQLIMLRFSDNGYATLPGDTPSNEPYRARIKKGAEITESIWSGSKLGERSKASIGDLILANSTDAGYALDAYLDPALYAWEGQEVRVYAGENAWSFADFYRVFTGVTSKVQFKGQDTIRVSIAGKKLYSRIGSGSSNPNVPHTGSTSPNLETYDGSNGGPTEEKGDSATVGRSKPVCLGHVFNAEPELVNEAGLLYRMDDQAIEDVPAVYDRALALTITTDWTKQASQGGFKLLATPDGQVTADFKGRKPGGTYIDRVPDLISELLTTSGLGGYPTSAIKSSFGIAASSLTAPCGIVISAQDVLNKTRDNLRRSINDIVDDLAGSVGGYIVEDQEGKFDFGRLELPTGTPVAYYDETNTTNLEQLEFTRPVWRVSVAYQRNNTIQTTDIAGAVSMARRNYVKEPYLLAVAEDETIRQRWKLAEEMTVPAWFAEESDAQDEADRLLAMYGTPRAIYTFETSTKPYGVKLGDTIQLTRTQFNLSAGKKFRVVRRTIDTLNHKTKLTVWG